MKLSFYSASTFSVGDCWKMDVIMSGEFWVLVRTLRENWVLRSQFLQNLGLFLECVFCSSQRYQIGVSLLQITRYCFCCYSVECLNYPLFVPVEKTWFCHEQLVLVIVHSLNSWERYSGDLLNPQSSYCLRFWIKLATAWDFSLTLFTGCLLPGATASRVVTLTFLPLEWWHWPSCL